MHFAGARPFTAFVLAAALLLAPVAIAQDNSRNDWQTYRNARFGTTAEVPAQGFRADPPPANGDGRSWSAQDGKGRISVYGSYLTVADTAAGYRRFMLQSARNSGLDVTYNSGGGNWFAYSGFSGGDIVYVKVVVSRHCDAAVANHIYLKYPASEKQHYAAIVSRMAASLRGSPGIDCR